MWQWINQNAQGLSFFASIGTFFVWLFYAHLLFSTFRRQRRARILINQGWGQQLDSVCLISNMSQEPIYLHSILMTIRTQNDEYAESITDSETAQPSDSRVRPPASTRQGPLAAGDQINLGTFRSLIRQTGSRQDNLTVDEARPIRHLEIENFKITVIASYGPEGGIVGAQRQFLVRGEDNELMRPAATTTRRMANRNARRRLQEWLERQL